MNTDLRTEVRSAILGAIIGLIISACAIYSRQANKPDIEPIKPVIEPIEFEVVEYVEATPSIGTALKIAKALDVDDIKFFEEE